MIAFKRSAILHFDLSKSKKKTAENFKILRPSLIKWINQRQVIFNKLQRVNNRRVTNDCNMKKQLFPDNEARLYDWFKKMREDQIGVSCFELQTKMLALMDEFKTEIPPKQKFTASYGCLRRFKKRNNLVIRRISGSGKGIPQNCKFITTKYLDDVNTNIEQKKLGPHQIFNFDETSFYMCSPGTYTVDHRGVKKSYSKSAGKEKVRLSCLMCSSLSGQKLPILCVVPRKKLIPNLELDDNLIIIYETKGFLYRYF